MAKENKDFEFRKPFVICKEFREKVDKCVNQHRNYLMIFLMAIVTISVFGYLGI